VVQAFVTNDLFGLTRLIDKPLHPRHHLYLDKPPQRPYTHFAMKVSQHAILNLSQLVLSDATDYEVSDKGLLMPSPSLLEADGLRLAGPLKWALVVRSTGGDDDLILEGSVAGTVLLECRRCLIDVPVEVHSELIYPMVFRPGRSGLKLLENEEDKEDALVFGRPEVDFSELLSQVFAIDLPLTALCKEDCKGLSADGVNLNEHPELAPSKPEISKPSPFATLKDLDV
jgi:uncharacterized protein